MPKEKLKPVPMPLDEFWKLVAELNWGHKSDGPHKTTNYKVVKKTLMQKLTRSGVERFSATFSALRHDLYRKLDKEVEGTGDDGFGDLLAHIIGLGKEEYERNLADPKLAQARVDKSRYVESFSYCIPYDDDYEMLDPSHHVARAKGVIKEYTQGLTDERYAPVHDAMRLIIDTFTPAANGEPSALLGTDGKLEGALKAIEARREFLHREGGRYEEGSAMVHNCLGDIKQFLG
jgi:hypothetical protein